VAISHASDGRLASPELALVDAALAAERRLRLSSVEDSWLDPLTNLAEATVGAIDEDSPSPHYPLVPALEPEEEAIQETEASLRRLHERMTDDSLAGALALDTP